MATWNQIKELRLKINDPANIINIISVAATSNLPGAPAPQTAYYVESTGVYVATELATGAAVADYETLELEISDIRLGSLIDTYGEDIAVCKALRVIASRLGKKLYLVKNTTGAESVEYIKLKEAYDYYKGLIADCETEINKAALNTTGRFATTTQQEIAGGNV